MWEQGKYNTLGVIGGMGSEATDLFFKKIIEKTPANCDQDHIPMIILNHSTIKDRTKAILTGETKEVFEALLKDAKFLEKSGVSTIAVPCNTSHYFLDMIADKVSIKIIHMVRETCDFIKNKGYKRVGLLATDGTIKTKIYQKCLEERSIEVIKPDEYHQQLVMSLIYDDIKAGKKGNIKKFAKIDKYLKNQQCDCAILACTELSCFAHQTQLSDFYIDAMDILVDESIKSCSKKELTVKT